MPVVATVDGVRILFYANEHPPPHFHAVFGEHRAVIDIASLTVTAGSLPVAKRRRVIAWASTRRAALTETFARAVSHERVGPIA